MLKKIGPLIIAAVFLAFSGGAAQAVSSLVPTFGFAPANDFARTFVRYDSGNDLSTGLERHCLAVALYHEARGEPKIGQIAVGQTILNRVRSSVYPNTVCGVVFQNSHARNACQFSFACDDRSDIPARKRKFSELLELSGSLLSEEYRSRKGRNDFFGAQAGYLTHYHRHDVAPFWSSRIDKVFQIGQHVFFSSKRVVKRYRADEAAEISQLPIINASNQFGLR